MSWEYSKYKARCRSCGAEGYCIRGSDDWGRSSTRWEGFGSESPAVTAVARKRADKDDRSPVCTCGKTNIEIREFIGDVGSPFLEGPSKRVDGSGSHR
jgi:hypothetical protein